MGKGAEAPRALYRTCSLWRDGIQHRDAYVLEECIKWDMHSLGGSTTGREIYII